MKHNFLIDADRRINDFHQHGNEFKAFIEETIHQLEELVKTAEDEINMYKRLRDAIGLTLTNVDGGAKSRLAPRMPLGSTLESELDKSLERELKLTPSLSDNTNKPTIPKQN